MAPFFIFTMAKRTKKMPMGSQESPAAIMSDDEKLLRWLRSEFAADYRAEKAWREEKKQWLKFYDGDQLSDEEKQALKERGQPEVVVNRIKPKIDSIIGLELALPVNTRAFDRGSLDFDTAKYITEALRYVEDRTDFDSHESDFFEDLLKHGRAWYETETKFEGFESETVTRRIHPDNVFRDRYCRFTDLSDCKKVHKSIWQDLDDARELFPDDVAELEELTDCYGESTAPSILKQERPDQYNQAGGDMEGSDFAIFEDPTKRKRVRLVTTWYRTPYRQRFLTAPGLEKVIDITRDTESDIKKYRESLPGAVDWTEVKYRLNCATFCWSKILEHKTDIRTFDPQAKYPFVTEDAFVTDDEKRMPYSLIRQMMDPQKEINKRRSKMLHLLNTNLLVAEAGAFKDPQKAREELNRPDGMVLVDNPGAQWKIERNIEVAQSQFQLLQESKSELDNAGVQSELEGPSRATSGRDFQLRQQQATQSLRKLFLKLRSARRRVGLLWLDDIQQYWTGERMIKLTDDPEAGYIVLNEKVADPVTGEIVVRNDVSLGKYDLKVEEAPDSVNLRSETFDAMAKLAASGVPIPPEVLIEASALPNKTKLVQQMQEMQAQQQQMAMMQAQLKAGGGRPQ